MMATTSGARQGLRRPHRQRWRPGAQGFKPANLLRAEVPQRGHSSANLQWPTDRQLVAIQAAVPSAPVSEERRLPGSEGPWRRAATSVAQTIPCSTAMRELRSTGAWAHPMEIFGAGHRRPLVTKALWNAIAARSFAGRSDYRIDKKRRKQRRKLPIDAP